MSHSLASGLKKSCANLALAFLLFNIATPALAANLSVDVNTDNNGAGCELREAVNSVNAAANSGGCLNSGDPYGIGDLINVTPVGNTITLTQGEIAITNPVIITGAVPEPGNDPAVTIDAAGASRIFNHNTTDENGLVEVRHLILNNGSSTNGGLIFVQPAVTGRRSLNLEDVKLRNSEATGDGGAIYMGENSNLDILNSEFSDNQAAANGGAIYLEEQSSLDISNDETYGAGFDQNYANDRGGAIFINGTSQILDINDSTFTGNNTELTGGAIQVYGPSNMTIDDSTFTGNYAVNLEGGHGGAIAAEQTNIDIDDTNFGGPGESDGNYTDGTGGAIYMGGGVLDLDNVNFEGNHSLLAGGAILMSAFNGAGLVRLIQDGGTYLNNYSGDPDFIIEGGSGGAIHMSGLEGAILNMANVIFDSNITYDYNEGGGAIYLRTDELYEPAEPVVTLDNVTFNNNYSEGSGGAMIVFGPTMNIINSTFNGNTSYFAGAIYALLNDLEINNSNFTANEAFGGVGAMSLTPFLSEGLDVIIHNTIFDGNIAGSFAGAIYCYSAESFCNLDITADSTSVGQFINNIAGEEGAAVMTTPVIIDEGCIECPPSDPVFPVPGVLNITNILFDNNSTINPITEDVEPGIGAAVLTGNVLNILGSIFTDNNGISIVEGNDDMNVSNTLFSTNEGAGVSSLPLMDGLVEVVIDTVIFAGNNGGGFRLQSGLFEEEEDMVEYSVNIENSQFSETTGSAVAVLDLGGTFFGSTNQINISDSNFLESIPVPFSFIGSSPVTVWGPSLNLINSTVANNISGGVSIRSFATTESTITNSTISNNTNDTGISLVANQGGGVKNTGGILNIINSTIANNIANSIAGPDTETNRGLGGGIYVDGGGDIFLTNTIISDNEAEVAGQDCYISTVGAGGTITSNGINLISDTTDCEATFDEDDILEVSALLEALADNGGTTLTRLLGALSPALDAGDDALAPADDQRGILRPQGLASDIGAVEMSEGGDPAPVIAQVTPVPTPSNDTTPTYTFSSTEAGDITYGGDCSSATTAALVGNNTITFNALAVGVHNNCTILVTDADDNDSNLLAVNTFEITAGDPAPVIAEVTPVPTPSTNTTPSYTFSSTESGSITYGGACSSGTTSASAGNNAITFNTLAPGTYTNCTITVKDASEQNSNLLAVSSFTIENPPTPPSGGGGGGGGAGGSFGQPASGGTPSNPPADPDPTLPETPSTPDPTQPEQPVTPEIPVQPEQPSQPDQPQPNTPDLTQPTPPDESTPLEPEIIFVTEETPVESSSEGAGIYGRDSNKTERQLSLTCNYSDFSSQYNITINQNSDADGDGLSDQLECLAQTNPTAADTDGDGLTDAYEELTLGSNPRQSDGQPGSDFLIITTPEENMLTGDESPMVKGINTLKGDVDIYIFDRADFDDIAKQLQDELNADQNLNDQQRSDLYAQRFTEYVQTILSKFIAKTLDPENPAEAKFINRIQLLGETPTASNSVFLLDSDKTLVDNVYLAMAHNVDNLYSRETEFEVDSTLKVLNPNVDTLGNKPISSEALLGELKIEIDAGNFRPVLAGNIKEPSKVVANWQSDIISSALIADSLDEDFRLSAPSDLEPGEHTVYVTAYRRSDGAQSETLKIPFTISADGTISYGQNNNYLWLYIGLGVIALGGIIFAISRKSSKPTPPPTSTPTTSF